LKAEHRVETVISIHRLHSVELIWLLSVEYGCMLLNSTNNNIKQQCIRDKIYLSD